VLERTRKAGASWVALDETNSIKEESAMSRQELRAEISGTIIEVSFSKGDMVEEGDTIIVMEAMKMEILAVAPCSGKIVEVRVKKDDLVGQDDLMAIIDPS
jgi:biotin carboxyl carrier protein